jgi:predicted DNA-binding transcriptional regulator YafY
MPTPDVTKLIERAIRELRVLRVTYGAEDGTVHDHVIEPLAIRFNSAKHRVLWCWNQDVAHIEEFVWDGIEDAVETGESFPPRPWEETSAG